MSSMVEVIILKTVPGQKWVPGDKVTVSGGYARNFLDRKQLATRTAGMEQEDIEPLQAKLRSYDDSSKAVAEEIRSQIDGRTFIIPAAANDQGRLYGSVGPKQIVQALKKAGIEITSAQIRPHAEFAPTSMADFDIMSAMFNGEEYGHLPQASFGSSSIELPIHGLGTATVHFQLHPEIWTSAKIVIERETRAKTKADSPPPASSSVFEKGASYDPGVDQVASTAQELSSIQRYTDVLILASTHTPNASGDYVALPDPLPPSVVAEAITKRLASLHEAGALANSYFVSSGDLIGQRRPIDYTGSRNVSAYIIDSEAVTFAVHVYSSMQDAIENAEPSHPGDAWSQTLNWALDLTRT